MREWIALDGDAFNEKFRSNPAKRPKRRGLLRNVAVALGNSGDARAVEPLIQALSDEEVLVRGHAAWGLGELGGAEARRALQVSLDMEVDAEVHAEIVQALEGLCADEESRA